MTSSVTLMRNVLHQSIRQQLQVGTRNLSMNHVCYGSQKVNLFDLNFDRRNPIDYKKSIEYLDSKTYEKNYQGQLVWKLYRRNHKNQMPSDNTRPTCVNEEGFLGTSYPCPICRDEYLVLHPDNPKLLSQFINPYTGEIYTPKHHGLCRRQYRNLIVAIHKARDLGTLTYDIPDRYYNMKYYFNTEIDN